MSRSPFAPPAGGPTRFPSGWRARLGRDPIPILLREGSPALVARVRRALIDDDEAPGPAEVAVYPEVKAFVRKQEKNGAFPVKAAERALGNEKLAHAVATLRALDRLTELGLDNSLPAVAAAAEFLLSSQGKEGELSALALGETKESRPKTVAPQLHGWALAVLCRAGLDTDKRVELGFRFLLASRQADGGWAWRGVRTDSAARPSSHLVTGMALRAFAASPSRRSSREARRAAELLATRFLQPDRYPDRRAATYWEQLGEPRFYTDVLDALDSATAVGLGKENSGVRTAEAYLRGRQLPDGLWYPGPPIRGDGPERTSAAKDKAAATKDKSAAKLKEDKDGDKDREAARWLTVRVLIVLRRVN
jgi:hypothetical protein